MLRSPLHANRLLFAASASLLFAALGTAQQDTADVHTHVISTETLMSIRSDAIPARLLRTVSGPDASGSFGERVKTTVNSRGDTVAEFNDSFSSYPTSTDPVFDRFQIHMMDRVNPSGEIWNFSQFFYIPTLFVEGQLDAADPSLFDPLPQWQGVTLTENPDLGILTADINVLGGDGIVDSADLGTLIADFGTSNPRSDINIPGGDGIVDTADLGVLISEFGQATAPFCSFTVTKVNTIDPDGFALDPTTVANAPAVGETIAIFNSGSSANDANLDGCPDCDFFNILVDGAVSGERLYGDWELQDSGLADLSGIDFRADVDATSCDGWGTEVVFADVRSDTEFIQENTFNLGARAEAPLFVASASQPLMVECDFFLTSYDTLVWFDVTSRLEGFTMIRMFMGGFAPAVDPDWLKYSTGGDGLVNHFLILGRCNCGFNFGQIYGTAPDPALPEMAGVSNVGKEILLNEWFTIRFRLTQSDISIWVRDSETIFLTDPQPGDEGDNTPLDGSDDIEDGFAKLFPFGPYGISPGTSSGQVPQIPQPPLAAISMDQFRWVYGGDPASGSEPPGFARRTVFFDNLYVKGTPFPKPDLPKFALNYFDDIELYFPDTGLRSQGDRWFDAASSNAIIDDTSSVSGSQSIRQSNSNFDGKYRLEFETDLPIASAETATWTAGVSISTSNDTVVRAVRLHDDTKAHDPFRSTVAHMLTGSENDEGNTSINESFFSTFHMRVPNPNFDPSIEPYTHRGIDRDPPAVPTNSPFINVPTNIFWDDQNVYHHFTFEVDSDRNLIVRRDGALVLPDPVGAIAAGYTDGMGGLYKNGWDAGSTSVTRMSFESGNQPLAPNVTMNVDDVFLDGFAPVYSPGPAFELPYADGFEGYPINTAIDGQGETPFVDLATLFDSNLCIEQGAQALNAITTGPGDWCEYEIKSDSIGGIDPANDWGLSDGDLIWVRQADCNGAVVCKDVQCFTNPNRPDEFFPNVGLFDPSGSLAPVGVRVEFVALRTSFDPPAFGIVDTFEWDTYDPSNVFGRYLIDEINDTDNDTPGVQAIEAPLPVSGDPTRNVPFYNSVGGKLIVGDTVAVDPAFDPDPDTGVTPSPGLPGESTGFKIVDPCGSIILSGMWTLVGDGASGDDATALECADIPHFNSVFENTARYTAETNGQSTIIDDPTISGRGRVLRQVNNDGSETGGSFFASVDSTYPEAFATLGTDSVLEFDCFVTDNNSRLAIEIKGSAGTITWIQLGGPDNDPLNSPGEAALPSSNFMFFENNPDMGPFGGPPEWFYDTGVAVPLNAWFRLQATVASSGSYTVAIDQSGIPGGDGVFETILDTATQGSTHAGEPIDFGANAITGFDTVVGNDSGGDGVFNRDPIEVIENTLLPGALSFATDFCFYRFDSVDGEMLGNLPAPCDGVFQLDGIIAIRRNVVLPNWPNGGEFELCPTSPRFIWNDDLLTGQCSGEWTYLDPDDDSVNGDLPFNAGQVDTWAEYVTIPPYIQPPPASVWYFDNITLTGSDMP